MNKKVVAAVVAVLVAVFGLVKVLSGSDEAVAAPETAAAVTEGEGEAGTAVTTESAAPAETAEPASAATSATADPAPATK